MTIPFFIEEPITLKQVEVPQEILHYCDSFTMTNDRENLRYIDCVWMHMGYYGTPAYIMEAVRDEWDPSESYNKFDRTSVYPIFE